MGEKRSEAQQKDNHEPASAENTSAEKIAAQEKTSSPSSYSPPQALSVFRVSSPEDIPITRDNILMLQRTVGNRAVVKLLQRKTKISQPGDAYEREADRVAEQIMTAPASAAYQTAQRNLVQEKKEENQTKSLAVVTPLLQREAIPEEELKKQEEEKVVQTMPVLQRIEDGGSFEADHSLENRLNNKGSGNPLPDDVRAFMEPRFGADFSQVRVHTGSEAVQMSQDVSAQAFTHGSDIYFGEGRSPSNLELTAHELTHVVQQTGGVPLQTKSLDGGEPNSSLLAHGLTRTAQQDDSLRRTPMPKDRFGRPLGFVPTPEQEEYDKETYVIELQKEMQTLIDGAVWKEIRKRVYPKESAAGIKRAKDRKTGALPDLTGLGKIATLDRFTAAIKTLQGSWGPKSVDDRVKAIGAAANAELTQAGVPPFMAVAKAQTEWKGFFQAGLWKFSISDALVTGGALSDADAAELSNTTLHEARHAEQHFLAARFAAGPPANKTAAEIAAEQGIPEDPVAKAAVAAKFNAATDPKVAALGKEMHKAMVTDKAANQRISDDDYTAEMATARAEAITSLAALKASTTTATIMDATAKRDKLKAAIAEVERRYTLYRNIPYEADAHEVGDAAEQAFKGWP
jgi:hypothetical protein